MSTPRTPPNKVQSENDISNLDPDNFVNYVGQRQKRPRNEDPESPVESAIKDEVVAMLSNWKKDLDTVLNKLCSEIAELKQQNAKIQSSNEEMDKSMKFMSSKYEEMKEKIIGMETERKENLNYIATLENKVDDLQKRLKFTVIEFRNIPAQIKQETQQDLCELVKKTCNVFETHIEPADIKDIYRISNKTGGSTVITEFTSVLTRNKILNNAKVYNRTNVSNKLSTSSIGLPGPSTPIYITESLTNKDRKLFAMARDSAKNLKFKYCWANRGRIYVRKDDGGKRVEIKNETDILTLSSI